MSDVQRDWSVEVQEDGRSGAVIYREATGVLSFPWEFGGGDVVAMLHVGDASAWRGRPTWAVDRRAEILQRVASEVLRLKAPGCSAEVDQPPGWIALRQRRPPRPVRPSPPSYFRVSQLKARYMGIVAIGLLVGVFAFWGIKRSLSIRSPTGAPLGDSVRTSDEIATLIQTLEVYVPSLHRNPDHDRYRLSLFLYPASGAAEGRLIPLAKGLRAQDLSLVKLLGCDGRTVWFRANDLGGLELATEKLIGPAELRAANPNLDEAWDDPRRVSFDQRLRLTSSDRSTVLELDPQTRKATPVRVERSPTAPPFASNVQDFLCAGVRPSPDEWLGLHSLAEAARDYKPGSRLTRANRAEDAKQMRRFHRARLGEELARGAREILSIAPQSDDEYLNAAFVRAGRSEEPLRLSEPDGFLMVFTSAPGLAGTLVVARVNDDATVAWKVDTGIDRFKLSQVLPEARSVAFVGTRPSEPGKAPEPILVVIDTRSAALSSTTLWK